MTKKVFIKDLSFELAEELKVEKEKIRIFLNKNGYEVTPILESSDYIILCTFGYFSDIEEITIKFVNENIFPNFNGKLIVYGELVGTTGNVESDIMYLNTTFVRVKNEYEFNNIFQASVLYETISSLEIAESNIILCDAPDHVSFKNAKKFYINTHRGCVHSCSFCAIQKSIGFVKSMPLEQIYEEVKEAVFRGYKEIVLLGEDFGSIGLDRGYTAVDALEKLCSIPGEDFKLYIHYFEPTMYLKYFKDLKPFLYKISSLQIGIQTFDNRILGEMNRKYQYEDVISVLKETKEINKEIFLQNQFMFAYPTETREDFLRIVKIALSSPYDVHVSHPYSFRPGMKLYAPDQYISVSERKARSYILNKLIKKYSGKLACSWIPGGHSMKFDEYFKRY